MSLVGGWVSSGGDDGQSSSKSKKNRWGLPLHLYEDDHFSSQLKQRPCWRLSWTFEGDKRRMG